MKLLVLKSGECLEIGLSVSTVPLQNLRRSEAGKFESRNLMEDKRTGLTTVLTTVLCYMKGS